MGQYKMEWEHKENGDMIYVDEWGNKYGDIFLWRGKLQVQITSFYLHYYTFDNKDDAIEFIEMAWQRQRQLEFKLDDFRT